MDDKELEKERRESEEIIMTRTEELRNRNWAKKYSRRMKQAKSSRFHRTLFKVIIVSSVMIVFYEYSKTRPIPPPPPLIFYNRTKLLGVLSIVVIGYYLYRFRQVRRTAYGIFQLAGAIAFGWLIIDRLNSIRFVGIIGGIIAVYLVGRGFDNINKGFDEQPLTLNVLDENGNVR
ncbi:MAG TPA: hypothetical protein VF596_16265 [Pyrinomonadaceae bacterium]|jgi:hypothetical protein